jgi:hypothetical protein
MLDEPAPAGGTVVDIASDLPRAEVPRTIIVPAGRTDGTVSPITTGPVPANGMIGDIRAAMPGSWQQSSLGVLPLLYGTSLGSESVVGGQSFTGTVTLQSAAPAGGAVVRLVSSDTRLARVPATVFIPEGGTDAAFTASTSPVAVPTRVVIETGTGADGYRAPQAWITLMPAGSPAPPPSLSSLTLNPSRVVAGGTATATVTLTSPAPAGGAVVTLQGSMEGHVVTPPSVTIPAGSSSADFTITAPQVWATHWVFIGAHYGTSGGSQARLLQIDPGTGGTPTLLAMGARATDVVGGQSVRATVGLVVPAPPGGAVVSLESENPGVAQVPPSASVAEGNSTGSFTITTSTVPVSTGVRINASAGGVTRSWFLNVAPSPDAAPLLQSMSLSPGTVAGGTASTGTVFLSAPAPANGISVTLSTSDASVARPPGIVSVPQGQTSATFSVTTFAVPASTSATITAYYDRTASATLNVTAAGTTSPPSSGTLAAPSLISPASDARFAPGQTVTFDWSDVAGAASYTLQVDDQDTFPSPLIVNQTLTASRFSTSTLPTTRMWYRVRANDASGMPGTWSSIRRFEVKN